MKYNKNFVLRVVLLIIVGVLVVGGVGYLMGKSAVSKNKAADNSNYSPTPETNNYPPTQNSQSVNNSPVPVVDDSVQSLVNCSNNTLGISFNYPKELSYGQPERPSCLSINILADELDATLDTGKMISGYIVSQNQNFIMFIGGATKNIIFDGELNLSDVQTYPDANQIKSWNDLGYKVEKKINKNGYEYILVHGRKEVDLDLQDPLLGNQLLVVFKLKSSKDFPAIGFQLVDGDQSIFYQIIDSVKIF